ncbi:MAG: preprotein translocase subunit SecG [Citrobacter freundii]|nr:MAG: preprotein translocase subunit SecG [Citrobacter freundii]
MTIFFLILVILASIVLALFVLIQNPKGGGLAGNIAGFSNQFMGVKQTTDVLEKGTWIFAGVIGVLCLLSSLFIGGSTDGSVDITNKAQSATLPSGSQTAPVQQQAVPGDSVPFPAAGDTNAPK